VNDEPSAGWLALRVGLVHVHQPALDLVSRTGLLERLGSDHILPNLDAGVRWAMALGDRSDGSEPDPCLSSGGPTRPPRGRAYDRRR